MGSRAYVKCPYRSMSGTGTGVSGVFSLVWVPSMDLYEHSEDLEIELVLATLIILLASPFHGQVLIVYSPDSSYGFQMPVISHSSRSR